MPKSCQFVSVNKKFCNNQSGMYDFCYDHRRIMCGCRLQATHECGLKNEKGVPCNTNLCSNPTCLEKHQKYHQKLTTTSGL
jgi:hypothetical protein